MGALYTVGLLFLSNIFMTYAWYGHLKTLKNQTLVVAILVSWGIAFFEYCLQVPGNRIGSEHFSLLQLKIMQEIITMIVFAGFLYFYFRQPLKWDLLWAGMCLAGAAYFLFRDGPPGIVK